MKPVEGLALGGRYHLSKRIAVGGMGEVWVAHDGYLGREVAVKVLREEFAGNIDFLNRLRTEARNSARLSHPGIAQMFDYGEQEGSGYLVMELVLGEPLSDLLEREPVVPVSKLLPILSQAAQGLHAAHEAGVVHRDVKPGNILLDRSGAVKLTDFGVSLAANQAPMTATGMVMGTAQYLSPEQAIGKPATPASDVYALGVVAYESLAGKRPFTGPTPVDIAVAHVNQPVPPLPPAVDRELAQLVVATLAKDPAQRPPSAAHLADAIDRISARLLRRGVSPRPTETVEPSQPGARGAVAVPDARRALGAAAGPTTDGPRSYPPRRVVQSRAATERGGERSTGRHQHVADRRPSPLVVPAAAPAARSAAGTGAGRPTTRAAVREARTSAARTPAARTPVPGADRPVARPRATTPSDPEQAAAEVSRARAAVRGAGPFRSWSWPAAALVVLAVALLIAALVGRGGHTGASPGPRAGDGMIYLSAPAHSAADSPTNDKDS